MALALLLATPGLGAEQPPEGSSAELEWFEKRIRPVLVSHCQQCHGSEEQSGGLRLDSRAGWETGGDSGPAIVPGQPEQSRLLRAIRYEDSHLQMPPEGPLGAAVVADFQRWIAAGAADPRGLEGVTAPPRSEFNLEQAREHWAYRLPAGATVPEVADTAWPREAIDRFLLVRLESVGLQPTGDAEPAALIRRLSYDLTGLPPEVAEVETFTADPSPAAYDALVDRYLASPRFGERWGRHWLDVVRFAESYTLRGLILREAWRYRDYVIESFNADRPLDVMIREQVAGDLLPAPTLVDAQRQRIATGFLVLGNHNLEEQDKAQLRMDVVDEQLDTIGKALLGQTLGCARCHDHKFDPIPTSDYYALAGILRNVQSLEDANVSNWIDVPLPLAPDEEAKFAQIEADQTRLASEIKAQKQLVAKLEKADPAGPRVVAVADLPGIVVDDAAATKVGFWKASTSVNRYIAAGYVHDNHEGQGTKTITFQPELPESGRYEVRLAYTPGSNRASNVAVTVFSADGEFEKVVNQREAPAIDGRFESLGQYRFERNGQGFVIVSNAGADGHVIADAVQFLPATEADVTNREEKPAELSDEFARAEARLKQLEGELRQLSASAPQRPRALSIVELAEVEDCRIHVRGDVHNQRELVPRGLLRVADYDPAVEMPSHQSGRLELAQWLTSPRNPLTARVFVNRAWHWLFGAGLVRTTDNFGTTGERPSHPELLDELAIQFMADGWSVKRLVRRLVGTRAYRLGTAGSAELLAADPENRLYGRALRRRLDAEALRDTMLWAAGTLDLTPGGPTIPAQLSADYGFVDQQSRRSVYVPALRNAPPQLFLDFDMADPSTVTGVRNASTVAPQALYLMNDEFVAQQARATAQRLLAEPALDRAARTERLFRMLLGRAPTEAELAATFAYLEESGDEAETWSRLVQAVFASLDFRYLN